MERQSEISYEIVFIETCKQSIGQSFNGRYGIVFKTKQIKIPLAIMDSLDFFQIYFTYFIKGDQVLSELDGYFIEWLITQKLLKGNNSPLFNDQVIREIYDANPHLYADDADGIKMSATQRDNKRRCVIRFCSQKFSSFLQSVYDVENYETVIFAQKGEKKRQAEKLEKVAKLAKTSKLKQPQEESEINKQPQEESEEDKGILKIVLKQVKLPVVIESEQNIDNISESDEIMKFYNNQNNGQFRKVVQQIFKVIKIEKPRSRLLHNINDTIGSIEYLKNKSHS